MDFAISELAIQVQELGFKVSHKGKGLFEISNLPEDLLQHFSSRSEEIEKKLPELRSRYPTLNEQALRDLAAKWTREKKIDLSQGELRELWEAKFAELGYNKEELLEMARSQELQPQRDVNHAELALSILNETKSVISKSDILRLGLQFSIGQKTIADVETELSQAHQAVELAPDLYSSKELIKVERQVAEHIAQSRGQQRSLLELRRTMLIPHEVQLTAEQSATLLQLLSTKDSTTTLVGDAGTGKSTLLNTVVRNYARRGYDIEALSPSALAAAGLKNKGIFKASTVAHYLTKTDSISPHHKLVIVDEASLLSSKDLKSIYERIKRGDQVILVGDPKQHQALSGGSVFAKLQELGLVESSRLTENLRQKEASPVIAKTVRLLAEEKPSEAFELLDKHDRLVEIADNNERFEAIVERYVSRSQQEDVLVVTQSNMEKDVLNELIRDRLIQEGRVDGPGITMQTNLPKNLRGVQRNFAFGYVVGDHFYVSQPVAGFRRGSLGEILEIDDINNTIKAKMAGFGKTKTVTIDLQAQGHFLSAYQTQERQFAVGDTISFLKTDRQLGHENGRRGQIIGIKEDGTLTVKTDDGRSVSFNETQYRYMDYGWASTSFRSQGTDTSTVLFSADTRHGLNFNSAYVACSRARNDIEIYTNSKEDFLDRSQEREIKTTTLEFTWPSHAPEEGFGLELSLDSEVHEAKL